MITVYAEKNFFSIDFSKSFERFLLGFYIFWEIVVKEVLHIASLLGCQYLYLFAADDTKETGGQASSGITVLYSEDWGEEEGAVPVCKLVDYYKNELKSFNNYQRIEMPPGFSIGMSMRNPGAKHSSCHVKCGCCVFVMALYELAFCSRLRSC